jgi:hypothetical protein
MIEVDTKEIERRKRLRHYKNLAVQWVLQIISVLIAFLPTIFFFSVKALLSPEGFWQNFMVYGLGMWFLGGLQLIFLFILALVSFSIWE